jgi:hypothetical protein
MSNEEHAALLRRYDAAKGQRSAWETLWQDCYDFALPQRANFRGNSPANRRSERLYDGTAMDAVDQLAASLLGHLTPPGSPWFGFKPGPGLSKEEAQSLSPALETASRVMQAHLDHSNFSVEIHQSFLDLVVGGTASLAFEEAEPGHYSAFRFTAVPLTDVVLEEGDLGFLDGTYRVMALTLSQLQGRYPLADLPEQVMQQGAKDAQLQFKVLECVRPDHHNYVFAACLLDQGDPVDLINTRVTGTPFINFRWMKSPGEVYGRSPVMKSLPDIKTANKVVELILKNASIAVTGIWQADDDGVLNPANIELVPGAIIPKAVGSKGLTPLEMPGKFDVSQLILDDLRSRIRHSLLIDRLPSIDGRKMTATEVLERSADMSLLLGATYGRLQTELLTPLIKRGYSILRRRGEVPDLPLDGRIIRIDFRSPLARAQGQRHIQTTLSWLQSVQAMGPEGLAAVDLGKTARYLGEALGVPSDLMRDPEVMLKNVLETIQTQLPPAKGAE